MFSVQIEINPYVLEGQMCDECHGVQCNKKPAPFYCASLNCLQYYCEYCWATIHSMPGKQNHRSLQKDLHKTPFFWECISHQYFGWYLLYWTRCLERHHFWFYIYFDSYFHLFFADSCIMIAHCVCNSFSFYSPTLMFCTCLHVVTMTSLYGTFALDDSI